MAHANKTLVRLSDDSELRVSAGDPDPTGWVVVDAAGTERGRIIDLVVATDTMKVVYLLARIDDGRRVLLPAPVARLDSSAHQVIFDLLTQDVLDSLPEFRSLPLTADEDARIHRAFTGREPIQPDHSGSVDRRRRVRGSN